MVYLLDTVIGWITLLGINSYHLSDRKKIIADLENMAEIDIVIINSKNKSICQSNLDRKAFILLGRERHKTSVLQ